MLMILAAMPACLQASTRRVMLFLNGINIMTCVYCTLMRRFDLQIKELETCYCFYFDKINYNVYAIYQYIPLFPALIFSPLFYF